MLADIRTIPRSRHNPQFNADALRPALRRKGIRYVQLPELGGLRRALKASPNSAWRNASFRGYADYMLTADFAAGLAKLRDLAAEGTVALMCAEAVPWRCHRSLVADALTARGAHVAHITSARPAAPHRMTPFAVVEGTTVSYPGGDAAGTPLGTRAPFHLEATVRALQRRPTNRVDVWEQDHYLRALQTSDGLALVEVANHGATDAPDVRFMLRRGDISTAARGALALTLRTTLGLDVDPEALQTLAEAEPRLRATAIALRGMRPPRFADLFEAFANVVPFQQVSLDAGVAIVGRMVERFGDSLEQDGRRFYAFPTAPVIAESRLGELRRCGLSVRKAETLRQVASAIAAGELSAEGLSRLSSEEALRELRRLKGIGPWSASLVLLRGMGRLDVFPPGDVGAARGLSSLMRVEPGPSLERVIRRFGDQRGYLYFCALGGSLLAKGLIRSAPLPARAAGSESSSGFARALASAPRSPRRST